MQVFVAQLVKNLHAMQETWVRSLGWEDLWRRERLSTPVFWPGEFHGLYNSPGQNTGVGSHSLLHRSSQPRDRTQVSHTVGRFFTSLATREAQEYWSG